MDIGQEVFAQIPGYPDYKVSNFGTVVSYRTEKVKVLKGNIAYSKNKSGRIKQVKREHTLVRPNNSGKDTIDLHILVARTFLGEMPQNHYVRHIDGDTLNNKLDNLEYVPIEHIISRSLATIKRDKRYRYTRTKEEIIEMRELYATGLFSPREIADKYNISAIGTVTKIISGKERGDIGGPIFNISVRNPEIFVRLRNAIQHIYEMNDIQEIGTACKKVLSYFN